jgi:diadenosine tetraphosphate (Ap4A) HIT family hydrolase
MPQSLTWDERLQGLDCPFCGPQPEVNDYKFKVASLRISTLYLFRDQHFRGYCLLVFDPYHATSLAQLPQHEYDAFMLDLKQAGQTLQRVLHPDHMNYECLGNSSPHLHWHVIPRYQNDPRWGRPVWEGWQRNEFNINRVVIGDQQYQDLVTSIQMCLHETEG